VRARAGSRFGQVMLGRRGRDGIFYGNRAFELSLSLHRMKRMGRKKTMSSPFILLLLAWLAIGPPQTR
jgi:hypothetical protein